MALLWLTFPRSKKKTKDVEEMQKERDSLDFDDDLSVMSMLSGNEARRKSIDSIKNDSIKTSIRKNKVFQHIKKEMEIRAKFKPVTNAADQVKTSPDRAIFMVNLEGVFCRQAEECSRSYR